MDFECRFPKLNVMPVPVTAAVVGQLKDFLTTNKLDVEFIGNTGGDHGALVVKATKFENTIMIPEGAFLALLPENADILVLNPDIFRLFYRPVGGSDNDA